MIFAPLSIFGYIVLFLFTFFIYKKFTKKLSRKNKLKKEIDKLVKKYGYLPLDKNDPDLHKKIKILKSLYKNVDISYVS